MSTQWHDTTHAPKHPSLLPAGGACRPGQPPHTPALNSSFSSLPLPLPPNPDPAPTPTPAPAPHLLASTLPMSPPLPLLPAPCPHPGPCHAPLCLHALALGAVLQEQAAPQHQRQCQDGEGRHQRDQQPLQGEGWREGAKGVTSVISSRCSQAGGRGGNGVTTHGVMHAWVP